MKVRHSFVFAIALATGLTGCSDHASSDRNTGSASASSLAAAASAGAVVAKPALVAASTAAAPTNASAIGAPVDLATDESCRRLALQTIRKQDPKADRVFLSDSTPAGQYHRDGDRISSAAGQYRTDTGWTPLTRFVCTVDTNNAAVSFTYQAGTPQTWAEMGDRH